MIWKNPSALIHNKWKKNLKCVACCPDDVFEKKKGFTVVSFGTFPFLYYAYVDENMIYTEICAQI